MGQAEIDEFLKKNCDKKFTARTITELLDVNGFNISLNLKRMRASQQVNFKKVRNPGQRDTFVYWYREIGEVN